MTTCSNLFQEVIAIGKSLVRSGLVISTWGNISCRLPETNELVITPSGMEYDLLTTEDLVVLDLSGAINKGTRKPSSEKDLHLEIYKKRPEVGAIVHTHSNFATAVSVVRGSIPPLTEDMAQLLGGTVATCNYAPAGSKELAVEATKALESRSAVLLANHGVVGVGGTLKEAMNVCLMVEKGAQLLSYAKLLGTPHLISEAEVKKLREAYLTQYGQR